MLKPVLYCIITAIPLSPAGAKLFFTIKSYNKNSFKTLMKEVIHMTGLPNILIKNDEALFGTPRKFLQIHFYLCTPHLPLHFLLIHKSVTTYIHQLTTHNIFFFIL